MAQIEGDWWGFSAVRAELTMKLVLVRLAQDVIATLGHIETAEHEVLAVTLELPWRENLHDVSCIPAGTYEAKRAIHHAAYEVWRLVGVADREAVDIHIGNTTLDTKGCILVGSSYTANHSIAESKKAFAKLMERTRDASTLTLEIKEAWCEEADAA